MRCRSSRSGNAGVEFRVDSILTAAVFLLVLRRSDDVAGVGFRRCQRKGNREVLDRSSSALQWMKDEKRADDD